MAKNIELALLIRPAATGIPVVLGRLRNRTLLRTAITEMVAAADARAHQMDGIDPVESRGCAAQARVLRALLGDIAGDFVM